MSTSDICVLMPTDSMLTVFATLLKKAENLHNCYKLSKIWRNDQFLFLRFLIVKYFILVKTNYFIYVHYRHNVEKWVKHVFWPKFPPASGWVKCDSFSWAPTYFYCCSHKFLCLRRPLCTL